MNYILILLLILAQGALAMQAPSSLPAQIAFAHTQPELSDGSPIKSHLSPVKAWTVQEAHERMLQARLTTEPWIILIERYTGDQFPVLISLPERFDYFLSEPKHGKVRLMNLYGERVLWYEADPNFVQEDEFGVKLNDSSPLLKVLVKIIKQEPCNVIKTSAVVPAPKRRAPKKSKRRENPPKRKKVKRSIL